MAAEYYHAITAHVQDEIVTIKTIKADEASTLPKTVLNRIRQLFPLSLTAKSLNPDDILAIFNIKSCRPVKMSGKVWDLSLIHI